MKKIIIPICLACWVSYGLMGQAMAQEEKVVWIHVTDSHGRPLPNVTVYAVEWRKPVSTTSSGVAAVPVPINGRVNDLVHLVVVSKYYTTANGGTFNIRISSFNRPDDPIPITLVRKVPLLSAQRPRTGTHRANSLPGSQHDFFQKGEDALDAQRFQEAYEYFSKAYEARRATYQRTHNKETANKYAEINRELGMTLMVLNKWSEALEKFQEATRVDASDDGSKYMLGICAFVVGDLLEAERAFREMGSSPNKLRFIRGVGNLNASAIYQFYGKLDDATRLEQDSFQQLSKEGLGENQEIADLFKNFGAVTLDALRNTYPLHMISPVVEPALVIWGKARVAVAEKRSGAYSPAVISPLNDLAGVLQKQERYVDAESALNRALSLEKRVFGHDHLFVGFSLESLADLETEMEKYQDAETHYAEAADIFEKTLGKNHFWIDSMHDDLAILYKKEGKYKEAEEHRLALKEMYCRPNDTDRMPCVVALSQLSDFYSDQDKYTEAIPPSRQALDIAKRMWAGKDAVGTGVILSIIDDLERLYSEAKNDAELEALHKEKQLIIGLGVAPQEPGPKDIWSSKEAATAIGLNGSQCSYMPYSEFTKYPKAKSLLESAQRAAKYIDGRDPDVIHVLFKLALIYYNENRLDEAAGLVKQALDSNERSLQPDRYDAASLVSLRATINEKRENYAEAEKDYKQSITTLEIILGQNHQDVGGVLFLLGQVQREQRNYAEAERNLVRALNIRKGASNDEPVCDDPDAVTILAELASLYVDTGRYADAEMSFHQALQAIGERRLSDYPNSVYILEGYARCLRKMGREDEAVKIEVRAQEIKSRK
jgi:tetratricopeptide (TPR) repeat protein